MICSAIVTSIFTSVSSLVGVYAYTCGKQLIIDWRVEIVVVFAHE